MQTNLNALLTVNAFANSLGQNHEFRVFFMNWNGTSAAI